MLVRPEINRQNQRRAALLAILFAAVFGSLGYVHLPLLPAVLLSLPVYRLVRRRCVRRMRVMEASFPPAWENVLRTHVAYFNALNEAEKQRFRQLVSIFLDEVRITGIGTEVDDLCRVLVAASAIIPIFGFPDWEYTELGEVLIYPARFDNRYRTDDEAEGTVLGMVGLGHLNGVMILSKPDLIAGFANPSDRQNVGIHEFVHLIDKADGSLDGVPLGAPAAVVRPWIEWIGHELMQRPKGGARIDASAYIDEAEYFAVLAEFFFEAPELLQRKNPELYRMLQAMFRQHTRTFLAGALDWRPPRLGRNSPCPCGSGKKYKACCVVRAKHGTPA